jgi:hypothetical protein
MTVRQLLAQATAISLLTGTAVHANVITLTVGDASTPTLSSAANLADSDLNLANSYDILIPAGTYTNDFANVTRPMTIEASSGPVTLQASGGQLLQDKGIIVTTSGLTVRGITFQGAAIDPSLGGNGAGIRDQATGGSTLRVENSSFIGNQDGILTAGSSNQETVQIISSNFLNNGSGTGQTHTLYVGDALSLLVQNSTFCGTNEGHDIKSRALSTTITGSQMFDGAIGGGCSGAGTTSYAVDIANGGQALLDSDLLIQGPSTHNTTMLRYGEEGLPYATNQLLIQNTQFINTAANAIGIQGAGADGTCQLSNTTFSGVTTQSSPATFCTTVSAPAQVNEPSTIWLLVAAITGLALVYTTTTATTTATTGTTTGN